MTRIISGAFGGRRLAVPDGRGTRPTTDRVRESLFSRLDHLGVLPGATVLDLYAGSGALGLEAASRGATHVVLVEMAAGAARTTRRNVRDLGIRAEVVVSDADRYLRKAVASGESAPRFDVAFLDPPYDLDERALAQTLGLLAPTLSADAVVVVERSARSPEPTWGDRLAAFADRTHGETALWYAEPVRGAVPNGVAVDVTGTTDPVVEQDR